MTALKHNKHICGQKPLVHQLSELRIIRDGLKARPGVVTQMGNQRACNRGRMVSVEILRNNQLGRPIAACVWTGGGTFARDKFIVHYNDDALLPSFAALGLPPLRPGANHTMVVCEEGTLLLQADGTISIFRKGKEIEDELLPKVAPRNHWKDWADNCLGDKKPLWTPFDIGWRITEPALLAVKATRFPGEELRRDAANFRFSNHDKANKEVLSRNYRQGFAPPVVA